VWRRDPKLRHQAMPSADLHAQMRAVITAPLGKGAGSGAGGRGAAHAGASEFRVLPARSTEFVALEPDCDGAHAHESSPRESHAAGSSRRARVGIEQPRAGTRPDPACQRAGAAPTVNSGRTTTQRAAAVSANVRLRRPRVGARAVGIEESRRGRSRIPRCAPAWRRRRSRSRPGGAVSPPRRRHPRWENQGRSRHQAIDLKSTCCWLSGTSGSLPEPSGARRHRRPR
jgi:hypothetical protein